MKPTALFFVTAVFAGGSALASEGFDFETADANGDGQLSQAEVSADTEVSANFDTWDANSDGFLDQAEVDAGLGTQTEMETVSDPLWEDGTEEGTSDEALQDDRTDVEYDPVSEDDSLGNSAAQDAGSVDEGTDDNSGIDE
ncbi:MAG TPA: hypothetical protein VF267_13835 [Gammaproteobacteria bacterium]